MFALASLNEPYFSPSALIKTTRFQCPPVEITQRTISHRFGETCKVMIGFDETLMNPVGNNMKITEYNYCKNKQEGCLTIIKLTITALQYTAM